MNRVEYELRVGGVHRARREGLTDSATAARRLIDLMHDMAGLPRPPQPKGETDAEQS